MNDPRVTKKINRKQLFISVGIALLLLLGGFMAWWSLYYNNPDRILASALQKLSAAETSGYDGVFTVGNLNLSFNGEVDKERSSSQAQLSLGSLTLEGQVKSNAEATYVQLQRPKEIAQKLIAIPIFTPYVAQLTAGANKLDGKWLKITGETKSVDDSCTSVLSGSALDTTQRLQLINLFRQHQFVQVGEKLGSEDIRGQSNWHYQLQFDQAKAKEFNKALLAIEPFKSSRQCLSTGLPAADTNIFDSASRATIHIWIAKKTHELTKLTATLDDKNISMNFSLFLDLGKQVAITMPTTNIIPLNDLLETIKKGR